MVFRLIRCWGAYCNAVILTKSETNITCRKCKKSFSIYSSKTGQIKVNVIKEFQDREEAIIYMDTLRAKQREYHEKMQV